MTEATWPRKMWTPDGATTIDCANQAEVDSCLRGGWLSGDPNDGPEESEAAQQPGEPSPPKRKHR